MMATRGKLDPITVADRLTVALEDLDTYKLVIASQRPDTGGAFIPEANGAAITEILAAVMDHCAAALIACLADAPKPDELLEEKIGIAFNSARNCLTWWRKQDAPVVIGRLTDRLEGVHRMIANAQWQAGR